MSALRRVIRIRPVVEPEADITEDLPVAAQQASPLPPVTQPASVVIMAPPPRATNKTASPVQVAASTTSIAQFIDLENTFRQATNKDALRLAFVNGARQIAPYDCAVLVECSASPFRHTTSGVEPAFSVVAASDIGKVDASARMGMELSHLLTTLRGDGTNVLGSALLLDLSAAAQDAPLLASLAELCAAMPHMHWLPLKKADNTLIGGLVTFHAEPPKEASQTFLKGLALPYAHAWAALDNAGYDVRQRLSSWLGTARKTHVLPIIAALALIAPVRFSVLAPAEIVGTQPILIAAPLDGFVQDIHVNPGDTVKAGQSLVSFVDTKVRNDVDVARKMHAVAFAKHQRALHSAVANHRENHEIAITKADADVAEAQLALAEDMLSRARAVAPEGGIAVFSARGDWLGRPVATGERIMEIVNPADVQVRIDLPVSDGVSFDTGAPLKVFLDGQPLGALDASLATMSYRPIATADNQMAYRLHATLPEGKAPPRLGARGTARIDGPYVPLGFYLFRRPLAAMRQKLGL